MWGEGGGGLIFIADVRHVHCGNRLLVSYRMIFFSFDQNAPNAESFGEKYFEIHCYSDYQKLCGCSVLTTKAGHWQGAVLGILIYFIQVNTKIGIVLIRLSQREKSFKLK